MKGKRIFSFLASAVMMVSSVGYFQMGNSIPCINAAYENTHHNSGNMRDDIVEVAKTQVGYHEGTDNDTKYNRWNGKIDGYPVSGYGYPWCQCFISWCADQAGIPTSIIPRTAGTSTGQQFFKDKGRFKYKGSYTPQKGDLMYLNGHVALVYDCSEETVYTIEGNFKDSVSYNTRHTYDSNIIGYGVPDYGDIPIVNDEPYAPYPRPTGLVKRGAKGGDAGWVQTTLSKLGYDIGSSGIDCDFGPATQAAVKQFQTDHGLEVDGIVGPETINKIIELLTPPPDVERGTKMSKGDTSQTLPDGDYCIFSRIDKNYYVDIPGTERPAKSGSNVSMWHRTDGTQLPECDVWTIKNAGNGFYTIAQKGTGMMLDVTGADTANGTNVEVYTSNSTDAQLWSITSTDTGYKIQAKCSGYCLDVNGGINANDTNLQVWKSNDSDAQRFGLVPYAPSVGKTISDGEYTIEYVAAPTYCFDAQGYSASEYTNGTNIQLWQKEGCNDSFKVKYLGDGLYTISESKSGYVLDINCGTNYLNNRNNLQLYKSNSGLNQKWIIRKAGNGCYNIISAASGYCIDLQTAIAEPRRNIFQYSYNGSAAQKWNFIAPVGMNMSTAFDAASGTVRTSSKTITYGKTYGELPIPKRTGYTFDGWYTDKNGGTAVTADTKVTKQADHTLYAHWTANTYNITLDMNCGNGSVIVLPYKTGDKVLSGAAVPETEECTFVGWSRKQYEPLDDLTAVADDIIKPDSDTLFSEDTTLYAVWIKDYDRLSEAYYGDIDLDGRISAGDRSSILDHISQKKLLSETALRYADVNGDGAVDEKDAEALAVIEEYGMENEGVLSCFYAWKRRYIPIEAGPKNVTLQNGEQYTIPTDEINAAFSSNDPKVAVVSKNGVVTAVGEGTAKITLVTFDSAVTQIEITVTAVGETQDAAALYGDVNLDGKVTAADATAIMQFLANRDKYALSEESLRNADVYGSGDGVTAKDALMIQQIDSGAIVLSDLTPVI